MTAAALLLIGAAVLLVWAGVKAENPIDVFVGVVSGRARTGGDA